MGEPTVVILAVILQAGWWSWLSAHLTYLAYFGRWMKP